MSTLGRYLVTEMHECDAARLDDEAYLREQCAAAAVEMGARVVGETSHRYAPVGVTVVIVLAESHLIFHTWPERRAASVDIFVCGGSARPERARDFLARAVSAARVTDVVTS
jgi:S-adenosylmethionine decarboxylase